MTVETDDNNSDHSEETPLDPTNYTNNYNVGFETIMCLCCYERKPISMKAFMSCKASEDKKHFICNECFTTWGSNTCFFCNPLSERHIVINFSPRQQPNIVINNNVIQTLVDISDTIIDLSNVAVSSQGGRETITISNNYQTNSSSIYKIFIEMATFFCWYMALITILTLLFIVV